MRVVLTGVILHPLTATAVLAQASSGEMEKVGLGATLVMAAFLLVAALVAVSMLCKMLVAAGFVPRNRKSRLRRTIIWFAGVVGQVRRVPGRRDRGRGPS